MITKNTISNNSGAGRCVVAIGMIFLLLLLTTANYFAAMCNDAKALVSLNATQAEDSEAFPGSPGGPDEKPPGNPVSFSEEYLHGHSDNHDFAIADQLFTHLISASEEIELVHFELLSPPPEC
ncbi:MAG: hypothetical protein EOO04_06000 [Chitinophagaceae bacterium]|nr:MAG: hypothetical protein EOO04_06000 [Chitinophagaceae bacterium]